MGLSQQPHLLLVVWPWERDFTFLSFRFLIYDMEHLKIIPAVKATEEIKFDDHCTQLNPLHPANISSLFFLLLKRRRFQEK